MVQLNWKATFICCLMMLSSFSFAKVEPTQNEKMQAAEADNFADAPPIKIHDPFERFNRAMVKLNDNLDRALIKPVATLYNKIMPRPLNRGIHNAFNNIGTVTTIINDALQLHFTQTLNDMWRFGINSTLGIGGLFDIAKDLQLAPYSNDFGLTMAYWGWRDSTYLVVPFFGPNTIRDVVELGVDYTYFSLYPYLFSDSKVRYGVYALYVIDTRAQLLKFQPVLDEAIFDRYGFLRNAYIQRRNYQIAQNDKLGVTGRVKLDDPVN